MLFIRKTLCRGCGMCVDACPQQAIRMYRGHAEIDQRRCDRCGQCVPICPQDAILDLPPASLHELQAALNALQQRTERLISKIETIRGHSP
jgi:ferredoxin